jgi:hypothetical protein
VSAARVTSDRADQPHLLVVAQGRLTEPAAPGRVLDCQICHHNSQTDLKRLKSRAIGARGPQRDSPPERHPQRHPGRGCNVTLPGQRTIGAHPKFGGQGRPSEAPALKVAPWAGSSSPHLPASASRSRCARSLTASSGGGCRLPAGDVGPCGGCQLHPTSPAMVWATRAVGGAEYPTAGQGDLRVRTWLPRRSDQSVPGIEPGKDWSRDRPESAMRGLGLPARTWSRSLATMASVREHERRPDGHRARRGRLDDSSRSAPPGRYRKCPHPCTNSVRPTRIRLGHALLASLAVPSD